MSITLRITIIVACLAFLALVVRWVSKGRLKLKYSLMWLLSALIMLLFAIFPQLIYLLSGFLGFHTPSNFVFAIGTLVLLVIALGLSMVVSWQSDYIRHLIQKSALMEREIENLKKR